MKINAQIRKNSNNNSITKSKSSKYIEATNIIITVHFNRLVQHINYHKKSDSFQVKDIQLHSIKKNCILSENVTFH